MTPTAPSTERQVVPYGPLKLRAKIVKGFQRGSSELGYPTANLSPEDLGDEVFSSLEPGVYTGWASLSGKYKEGGPYMAAVSIGWNPVYNNKEKTVEPYLLHKFEENFYGETMKLIICGYVRPMLNFTSLQELIDAIEADCRITQETLDLEPYKALKTDSFLSCS